MRVATSFDDIACSGPVLLTIGTFDGVHRGHRFLLEQAEQRAREHGYQLVIVTFEPCPAVVLRPSLGRYQLTSATQKIALLAEIAPALVVVLPFTRELAALSADQFLDALEGRLELRELWMGEDFHFGRDRQGGLALLVQRGQRDGFAVHVVTRRTDEQTTISSSRVRDALAGGDVAAAMPLLGRPHALELAADQVRHAEHGALRALWFAVAPHLVLPTAGAYATLLSGSGETRPAAVTVHPEAAERQLRVWPMTGADLPASIEFIAPVVGQGAADDTMLLEQVRGIVAHWQRPRYAATGDL